MAIAQGRRAHWGAAALIAVLTSLAAAGCTGSTETPETIYITPAPGPATPLPSGITPGPNVGQPTPVIDSVVVSADAPDKRWTVTFKKPAISGISSGAATKINDAIAAKVNGYISSFSNGGLPVLANGAGQSTLEGDFTIAMDSPTLLSLRFTVLTYTSGAAHPVGAPGSINFVVASGTQIGLTDILTDANASLPTLSSQAGAALKATLGTDLTWSGTASSISFFDKAWAMTPAGLEFTWGQGELASEAAGMPSATLDWTAIKSLIKPDGPAHEFVQ